MGVARVDWTLRSALVMLVLSVAGCQTVKPPTIPAGDEVKKKIDHLYTLSHTPIGDKPNEANDLMKPADYARAGYTVVNESCNSFFDGLTRASNGVQMTKADWTAVGAAAATILALTHTNSAKPVGIAAAAFALGGLVFDNYQKYALLTPYPEQTQKLVFAALKVYATNSPAESAVDMIDADARISGYSRLCTYSGIATLAQDAISTATPSTTGGGTTSVFTSAGDQTKVGDIQKLLQLKQPPADKDLAVLAVMVDPQEVQLQSKAAESLSADVAKIVWDSANGKPLPALDSIKQDLADLLSSNAAFKAMVDKSKSDSEAASKPPKGGPTKSPGEPVFVPPVPPLGPWTPPVITVNATK